MRPRRIGDGLVVEAASSSSSRIRSVFARIAVMLLKIHFGGAVSGIASIRLAMSKLPSRRAAALRRTRRRHHDATTNSSFIASLLGDGLRHPRAGEVLPRR